MSNTLTLEEVLVDTLIPAWTGLEIWHASTQGGAYSLLAQVPYVAGQVTYTYVDLGGLASDWYEIRRYGPGPVYGSYSSTWSVTVGAPPRRSLVNYRRLLAEKLGGFSLVTTDTNAPDMLSIIASDLAGGLDSDSYRQAWVYPTQTGRIDPTGSAFKLRRVGTQALNTSTGQLTVTVPFPTIIASGVDVELHTLLPPVRHDKMPGLRGCLNAALAEMWTYARLALTGVGNQPSYDLSTVYEWLEPGAINDVYGPALDATLNPAPWPGWQQIQNSNNLSVGVSPTFGTGAAALAGVFRPADTWVQVGGVWGPSSTGLVNDTDQALFNPEVLVLVALRHAYHALSTMGEASERAYYAKLEEMQRARVGRWKLMALPRPDHAQGGGVASGYGSGDAKDFGSW